MGDLDAAAQDDDGDQCDHGGKRQELEAGLAEGEEPLASGDNAEGFDKARGRRRGGAAGVAGGAGGGSRSVAVMGAPSSHIGHLYCTRLAGGKSLLPR